ncbi:MAG: Flp pilus assembly protein CpaB [Acidobacteriota bacterium]|nr:Flp pilus assembly protein CpaB [Acidobacteriota bacterium]
MDRRKILVLFGVAWISAALLTWFLYARTQAPKEQKRVAVMAATRDLQIGAMVRKADLKKVNVLESDLPKGALFNDREALNRVALYPVNANEPLTTSKLSTGTGIEGITATIQPGFRAVSVPITDTSGVAGLIQPGARVDVLFTRPGSMAEAITSTILQNVKVLAIGRLTQVGQTVDPKAAKVPVATLIVTPDEAQKLELAKSEGKISLALRNPLDFSNNMDGSPVTTEILDPMISARTARARRGRTTNLARNNMNLEDPKVWQELTGEKKVQDQNRLQDDLRKKAPPPAPRAVVDVYRGDKHVQEVFHD